MFIIGELKDKSLAEDINKNLSDLGMDSHLYFDEKTQVYVLATPLEERFHEAQDYYRVRVGLPKRMEIEPEWVKIKSVPRGQYTYVIILVCVVIFGLSYLDIGRALYDKLFISRPESSLFEEILKGQIWRLVTPIFIHLSILHILFNMLWFKDLGYIIEYKFGKYFLLKFILISGIISNLLQYFVAGPSFGGMSGVLYAMLGFIWVAKKLDDGFEYSLPQRDMVIMLGWLVMCLTGYLGPIANTAHAGGLFAGMVMAMIKSDVGSKISKFKYLLIALGFLSFTLLVEGIKLDGRYFLLLWL